MADLGFLVPAGILFVVAAIALSLGADVTSTVQDDTVSGAAGCNSTVTSACGYDYNITGYGLGGLNEVASWMPTIALVVAAAIIIGVVVRFLGRA